MAYVAARGGEEAIQRAERLYRALNGGVSAELVRSIERHLPYLVDRVMGEGSLYAPELAALAIAQTGGDLYESLLLLRAYRSTQPRIAYAEPVDGDAMLTVRRISSAFKDVPGGQVLGPTLDYSHRILQTSVLDGGQDAGPDAEPEAAEETASPRYPPVAEWQRLNGLLDRLPARTEADPAGLPDITREPIAFPAPREHRLQSLARADTGGLLALGYSSMRGYGLTHPTVNELKLAYADVRLRHPYSGTIFSAGRIRLSQCEVVTTFAGQEAKLGLGFAATMGWNEVKIMAGSMLDMEMDSSHGHPAHGEEFVLYHTEPVEASGFCIHYKLPHYVTFSSALDNIRGVQARQVKVGSAEAVDGDADDSEPGARETQGNEQGAPA